MNVQSLESMGDKMKDSERQKYLGDMIDISVSLQATVEQRKTKGEGIVSEILVIINEIPLGKHRIEVALRLREAMLVIELYLIVKHGIGLQLHIL